MKASDPPENKSQKAAYRLRKQKLKWHEVGTRLGLTSPNRHIIAMRYARKYAKRMRLAWPPKVDTTPLPMGGKTAYELRAKGIPWLSVNGIGELSGLGSKARGRAKQYAQMTGQPWPVKFTTPAERAYTMRCRKPNMAWADIARQTGYKHGHHAYAGAKRHALKLAAEWLRNAVSTPDMAKSAWDFVKGPLLTDRNVSLPPELETQASEALKKSRG